MGGLGRVVLLGFLTVSPYVLAGSGKNDNAEKVAEKLEALSVKEENKESEDAETKDRAEEEQ